MFEDPTSSESDAQEVPPPPAPHPEERQSAAQSSASGDWWCDLCNLGLPRSRKVFRYRGKSYDNECIASIRSHRRALQGDAQALLDDSRKFDEEPEAWRQSLLPYNDPATRAAAVRSTKRAVIQFKEEVKVESSFKEKFTTPMQKWEYVEYMKRKNGGRRWSPFRISSSSSA